MTKELKNYIAGRWVTSSKTFEKRSPFNGDLVATVHEATAEMVDKAVTKGREVSIGSQANQWGDLPMKQRLAVIYDFADNLIARVDDLIEADMADTGRSYWQASKFDGARAARLFRGYADAAISLENRSTQFAGELGFKGMWYTNRRPKGVIACICPWNVPLLMAAMKVAPALVMGNAAILKPSEETPSSATVLAEVIAASDIPDGAFSLVHGFGVDSAGAFLTAHPQVDAITFTGESGTGASIMKVAAKGLRDVSLELGGKNAALVFEDARMDAVAEGMTRSAFFNCGQICFCTERAYVHRSRFDEYVKRMANIANGIVIGQRDHDGFNIPPLVSHSHRDKVKALLDTVPEHGGEFVAGGGIPTFDDERENGAFIQPSIAIGSPEDAPFVKQELFGPVLHVAPFDDEEEAIALANDTQYGLGACIWTENHSRALRVAPKLRVGHTWVNSWQIRDLLSPLTGAGSSGIGEQGGRHSLEFSSLPQTVTMRIFESDA
ncbi:aldehyde dehydrogenase family protein [Sulfitobacter sp. AS92]|uniref:aldehyde dehydrogenase family protein n=1 Tax=Sulfitobacter sp. AS92 TaxID=3135783 RepID=UPI003178CB46